MEPRKQKTLPVEEDYDGPDRRTASIGGQAFAGLPLWSRVVAMVGIPGTLCFFLVWVGANYIPKMYAELVSSRAENEKVRMVLQQQTMQMEMNYRLLQRVCSTIAKTDDERQRCFDR